MTALSVGYTIAAIGAQLIPMSRRVLIAKGFSASATPSLRAGSRLWSSGSGCHGSLRTVCYGLPVSCLRFASCPACSACHFRAIATGTDGSLAVTGGQWSPSLIWVFSDVAGYGAPDHDLPHLLVFEQRLERAEPAGLRHTRSTLTYQRRADGTTWKGDKLRANEAGRPRTPLFA